MSKASEQLELLAETAANLEDVKRLARDRDALLAALKEANRYLGWLCTCSQCLGKQAELKSAIAQAETP